MTPEQLNLKYVLVDRKKDFEVIDFCQKNALSIQNLDEDKDEISYITKRNLLSDYGYSLAKSGQNEKATFIQTEALRLHERQSRFRDDKNGYQPLLFLLGEAQYNANRIEEAKQTFQKLIEIAPDNASYKSWVVGTTNYQRRKISKVAFTSFVIWLLISVLLGNNMTDWFRLTFDVIGLLLFVTWAIVDLKSYFVKRKYR